MGHPPLNKGKNRLTVLCATTWLKTEVCDSRIVIAEKFIEEVLTMEKLFKRKIIMVGAITALMGMTIMLAGLTLAWWTYNGRTEGENIITIDMDWGNIDNGLRIESWNKDYRWETSISAGWESPHLLGSVRNETNLTYLVPMRFLIEIRTLQDMNDPNSFTTWRPATSNEMQAFWLTSGSNDVVKPGVNASFSVHPMGIWTIQGRNDVMYTWGHDPIANEIYITMRGNDQLHFAYYLTVNPDLDKDIYDRAEFRVSIRTTSFEILPGQGPENIIPPEYYNRIEWFQTRVDVPPDHGRPVGPFSDEPKPFDPYAPVDSYDPYATDEPLPDLIRFAELIDSLAEGAFKDLIVSVFAENSLAAAGSEILSDT